MDFVLEHLAIGGHEEARSLPREAEGLLCVAEERDIAPEGRAYHKVPMRDMQPIPSAQMLEAVLWIRREIGRRRLLVFCNAGVGRSVSVVVGYLCCFERFDFGSAVEFVAQRKPYMSVLPLLRPTILETRARLRGFEPRAAPDRPQSFRESTISPRLESTSTMSP